jgi:hypothetical protein
MTRLRRFAPTAPAEWSWSGWPNAGGIAGRMLVEQAAEWRGIGNLGRSAERFSNVHLLDLNDLVCPDGICNAVTEDGLLVFRDSQHLTDRFVRGRIPMIRDKLGAAVRAGRSLEEVSP